MSHDSRHSFPHSTNKKNEHKICHIHVNCKGLIFLSELIKAVAFSVICKQEIIKMALNSKDR